MFNLRHLSFFALLALVSTVGHADNCEPIRARIEANIASKGLVDFSVMVVESGATVSGEVVGSCDNGTRKIVYARGDAAVPVATPAALLPAAAPVAPARAQAPVKPAAPRSRPNQPTPDADILTECKDGSVSVGGSCRK